LLEKYKQIIYKENIKSLKTFNILSEEDKENKMLANIFIYENKLYISFVFSKELENYIYYEIKKKKSFETIIDKIFIRNENNENISKGALYFWSHLFPLQTGFTPNNILKSNKKNLKKIVKFKQMPLNIAFLKRGEKIIKTEIEDKDVKYEKEETYIYNNFIKGDETEAKFVYLKSNEEVKVLAKEEISGYITSMKNLVDSDIFTENIIYDFLYEVINYNLLEKNQFYLRLINLDNSPKYKYILNDINSKLNIEEV